MPELDLLSESLLLKDLARTGWVRCGVEAPESVAAHSWGVALLALALCPAELDRERAISLALVHDLVEVRTGDRTPHDPISPDEKRAQERAAAQELFADSRLLSDLWSEYDHQLTPEARFVHQLDRLDMALQARLYAAQGRLSGRDLAEFLASARAAITDPDLAALVE